VVFGGITVVASLAVAIPALGLAVVAGALAPVLALSYASRIAAGSAVDAATLLAALRTLALRGGRPRAEPLMQALCAGLLALAVVPFVLHPTLAAAARAAACVVLLVLALIDARCGLLPDALTLPLMWAGLLLSWAGAGVPLDDAVVAAAASYLALWGLNRCFEAWRGQAGMGGGDMKLAAALGAWLGWQPLPGLLLGACVAGIFFALPVPGRRGWRASLPFGPFLAVAGAFGLVGEPVVQFLFCLGNVLCTRSV